MNGDNQCRWIRALGGVCLALFAGLGCGESGGGADSGPTPADADPSPDAFDPCPGAFTFEALVFDLESGAPVSSATVRDEEGDAETTSAPNGRAVLCLAAGDRDLELSKEDHLTTRYALDAGAAAWHQDAGPFSAPMLAEASAGELTSALGETWDSNAGLVLIEVRSYPGAEPASGAEVAISRSHDAVFAADDQGDFAEGAAVAGGARILFVNVEVDGPAATATVSGPSCGGPRTLAVGDGELSYTLFACE